MTGPAKLSWLRSVSARQCQIFVHIQPGARRTALGGLYGDDRLKLAVQAPPVDGEANKAVIEYFSDCLSIPKSDISILSGHKSRSKTVLVERDERWVRERLNPDA